jgi:tetratricopeptide (TPR) repeat protein
MNRGDVGLVLGLAGFLLGGYAVFTATSTKGDVDDGKKLHMVDNDAMAGLGARVEKLDASHKELTRRVNGLDVNPRSGADRVKALEERVEALEKSGGAAPAPSAPKDEGKAGATLEEFAALQKKVFEGDATTDEQARFWELLRLKPELLADAMKRLEKAVADNPGDHEARMKLSRAYLAKLFTVPDGPEKGVWSMKAMEQYRKVLEADPNHWEARYSLAFNYSQWPDFLNKRPDAIREFETLRKIQENATPEPQHARTYFQLRQLYLKDGRTEDAKAVLEEGVRRFPDDEELKKAKDGAK